MRRFLVAHSGESSQRFVYAADNQLYFGSIDALGQGTAKKFGGGSLFTGADVIPMFGGYGIVYSTDNTIYYLRVDQNGVVTEPERAIGIDAKVQLIGAVFDGQALWVVYGLAPGTGTESWNVYVRRIA